MKENFDNIYSQPTPKEYVQRIVRDLDYQLPFAAMQKVLTACQARQFDSPLKITILGSSYGLESVVLKTQLSLAELITRWQDETTIYQVFPSTPHYQINFVDIQPEPLHYAMQVKLCDRHFVADICQPYSDSFERLLKYESDVITGIGIAYYIGKEDFQQLIKTILIEGKARFFCYSVPNYQDSDYLRKTCLDYGLSIEILGKSICQRRYANSSESTLIQTQLKKKNMLTSVDKTYITTNLYLVSRPE